jgi:protein subunit release factor A
MEETFVAPNGDSDSNFGLALAALTQSLQKLQTRYDEVQSQRAKQQQIQEYGTDVEARLQGEVQAELDQELARIRSELEALSLELESELLTDRQLQKMFWDGLRRGLMGDVFWQIVRFGGLGLVLGWALKSWVG